MNSLCRSFLPAPQNFDSITNPEAILGNWTSSITVNKTTAILNKMMPLKSILINKKTKQVFRKLLKSSVDVEKQKSTMFKNLLANIFNTQFANNQLFITASSKRASSVSHNHHKLSECKYINCFKEASAHSEHQPYWGDWGER